MIRVISSFADGPVNFHSTGPPEDQIQKLISSTVYYDFFCYIAGIFFPAFHALIGYFDVTRHLKL